MPGGWHPPQYWVAAGAWFFGTWTCAALVTRGGHWVQRRAIAPTITVEHYGGENVTLVVTNNGPVPVKFLATGQLLDLSEVKFKRTRPFTLSLWHGHVFKPHETTHALIAGTSSSLYYHTLYLIGDGGSNDAVDEWKLDGSGDVHGKWIRFTVTIRTDPAMRRAFTKGYECRCVRDNQKDRFEIQELTQ